ncbi:MAG TPA: histidinol-phosphate transaminase [Polyangia bacterium]|jgi:histidinol-phosphate/aromatic aminotransferase/cobyric acid decarboxylase-like protein|nr:histidinol-phosphate transaminase [Polyangia bacterium]
MATPSDRDANIQRVHGGPKLDELHALGIASAADLIDFSVNLNPYGPAPAMVQAIRSATVDVYPDPTALPAREALARSCAVSPDQIVLGNGAAELLWTLARVLAGPGRTVVIVEPTFSEFRAAAKMAGATVVEWRAPPETGFAFDVDAIAQSVRACAARALYLCSPNNPTGSIARASEVSALAAALPDRHLILDQAFLSLSEHYSDGAVRLPANVVRVRSLTKEHTIPGVRVGYLLATPALAAAVEASRPPWTTSAAAQAAALASVSLTSFVDDSRRRLLNDRRELVVDLDAAGLSSAPTATTFCLVSVPSGARLRESLLVRHRILVRDCASFGMPSYIRLAARPAAERARLVAALKDELGR